MSRFSDTLKVMEPKETDETVDLKDSIAVGSDHSGVHVRIVGLRSPLLQTSPKSVMISQRAATTLEQCSCAK